MHYRTLLLSVFLLLSCEAASAQIVQTQVGDDVSGRVVNALNGAAIQRALVTLNSRSVLTDADGAFRFSHFTENLAGTQVQSSAPRAWVKLTKPGFQSALNQTEANDQIPIFDLAVPLVLPMFPDGILSGTVSGSDKQPIAQAQVSLYRLTQDEASTRAIPMDATQTSARGAYRFGVGGGRYFVLVRYGRVGGEVILPERYPENSGGDASTRLSTFVVNPGSETRLDLHVRTGVAQPVTFRMENVQNARFTVKTSNGTSFQSFAQPGKTPGEFHMDLPNGTYVLHGVQQGRDQRSEAEARVTVAGRPAGGFTMHFVETPAIPVVLAVDAAPGMTTNANGQTIAAAVPTVQSLNLRLERVSDPEEPGASEAPIVLPDKTYAFRPGLGSYRLSGQANGQWFVESAQYGSVDLLHENLTVGAGSSEPITLRVSNAFGQVAGTVRKGGHGVPAFAYLLPHGASLNIFYMAKTGTDGSYSLRLPQGAYTLYAFEHRFPGDLRDPETVMALTGGVSVQITVGIKAAADAEAQIANVVK